MNIKDRLNYSQYEQEINTEIIQDVEQPSILDIFVRDSYAEKIIYSALNSDKNIMVASDMYTEKEITLNYIKSFLENTADITVINSISRLNINTELHKLLVLSDDIVETVRIFEYILHGLKSVIFPVSVKSFQNISETLRTLILLNFANLNDCNAKNLIGQSDALVVFIAKNSDGLFYIKNIGEINYFNSELNLKVLYEYMECDKEQVLNKNIEIEDEKVTINMIEDNAIEAEGPDITDEISQNEDEKVKESIEENIADNEETVEEIQTEEIQVPEEPVNKYKILREKVRNKKKEQL